MLFRSSKPLGAAQAAALTHTAYAARVTSVRSIQNAEIVTSCSGDASLGQSSSSSSQPIVKVVFDALGVPVSPPRQVDLSDLDADGRPVRSIIKTTDPERYGINVGDYFV